VAWGCEELVRRSRLTCAVVAGRALARHARRRQILRDIRGYIVSRRVGRLSITVHARVTGNTLGSFVVSLLRRVESRVARSGVL